MAFSDIVQSISSKVLPEKRGSLPLQPSATGGIGSGGVVPFEDDMIVSKPAIIFHASQVFFNFLAMCCFASVAAFQAKWKVGPSGLTGFALFVSIAGMFLSLFMLFVPVVYEKYDKGARLARALKEMRVSFILAGVGNVFSLLIAFITTISAWTEPGCKDASKDPNAKAKGKDFQNGLSGWCSTKKAGAIFFWLAFGFWLATFILAVLDWRSGKASRPRDPPFVHPEDPEDFDDDDATTGAGDNRKSAYSMSSPTTYSNPYDPANNSSQSPFSDNNRYSGVSTTAPTTTSAYGTAPSVPSIPAPRQSMDVYGAFSDPAPTGYTQPTPPPTFAPPISPPPTGPSRVLQYATSAAAADPYDAVRSKLNASRAQSPPRSQPPSYSSYPNPYQ
ncbi:hypothetical protein EIP86_000693 [Pleurotus ostreatoroseus]|nr:hypothetical protein EIP86_000693 [Pleurotus ostreatoroseus]